MSFLVFMHVVDGYTPLHDLWFFWQLRAACDFVTLRELWLNVPRGVRDTPVDASCSRVSRVVCKCWRTAAARQGATTDSERTVSSPCTTAGSTSYWQPSTSRCSWTARWSAFWTCLASRSSASQRSQRSRCRTTSQPACTTPHRPLSPSDKQTD